MKQYINVTFLQRAYCVPSDYTYLSATESGAVKAHREKPYLKDGNWYDADEDEDDDSGKTTINLAYDVRWEDGQYQPNYNLLYIKDYADHRAFAAVVSWFASKDAQANMIDFIRQWATENPKALDLNEIKAHTGLQLATHHENIVIEFLRPVSRFYEFRGLTLEIPTDARYLACSPDGLIYSFKERPVRAGGLCGINRQQVGWTARPFDFIHEVEMK